MSLRRFVLASSILVLACGTAEDPAVEPASEVVEPEVLPAPPPPEPPPAPIEDCPTETWSVAPNGPNRATDSGVEAAGWARTMGSGWERLRACKNIDGFEHLMSCAPVAGGAECGISLPAQRCTATLPGPTLPIALGQWVDTHDVPSEGSWRCTRR